VSSANSITITEDPADQVNYALHALEVIYGSLHRLRDLLVDQLQPRPGTGLETVTMGNYISGSSF
jgi:hypothetical protein